MARMHPIVIPTVLDTVSMPSQRLSAYYDVPLSHHICITPQKVLCGVLWYVFMFQPYVLHTFPRISNMYLSSTALRLRSGSLSL
ncbi:hypothetical protein BDR05DRAFT_958929 [Suillus weaverae]|nr:hypothetical protein BDR05DRAFT_958929 [Suillus weaverae]